LHLPLKITLPDPAPVPVSLFFGKVAQPFQEAMTPAAALGKCKITKKGDQEGEQGGNGENDDHRLLGPVPVPDVKIDNGVIEGGADPAEPGGDAGHKVCQEVDQEERNKEQNDRVQRDDQIF